MVKYSYESPLEPQKYNNTIFSKINDTNNPKFPFLRTDCRKTIRKKHNGVLVIKNISAYNLY